MNAFFAMNVPTTNDDGGYLLWAAQNWLFLLLPTLVFLTLFVIWVARRVRACAAGTPGGSASLPPDSPSETMDRRESPDIPSGSDPDRQTLWLFWPKPLPACASGQVASS